MRTKEILYRLQNGAGAIINGLGDPLVIYKMEGDQTGAGEVISRNPLRGTITIRDFSTRENVTVPAKHVSGPQFFK